MTQEDRGDRQESERMFHDGKFAVGHKKSHYELAFNSILMKRMMSEMGNLEKKKVCEFGCGTGWFTRKLAQRGGAIWTFDISSEAVKRVRETLAEEHLGERVQVDQMAGERLAYASDSFDFVVGIAVLHHLNLAESIKEIRRVLRKGGRAYFMEPLGHNPFLNAFRLLTPQLRSKEEMPLRFGQFEQIREVFPTFKHEEYYLTAFFALALYYVGLRDLVLKTRDLLYKLDKMILSVWPGLRRYCWYTLLVMEK